MRKQDKKIEPSAVMKMLRQEIHLKIKCIIHKVEQPTTQIQTK
jgi:hypothetical protein